MAPRSIWNGTITFGLVNVPIKLYSATESKTRPLPRGPPARRRADRAPARSAPKEDKEVPYDEVVKGYEVSEGKYVVLEKDEIKAAAGDRGKVVDSSDFVDAAEIDPVFYEKTYYVGSRDDADAYRLLHEALRKSGARRRSAASPSTTASTWSRSAPLDDVLALHTLRFHDEIVAGDDLEPAGTGSASRPKQEIDDGRPAGRVARTRSSSPRTTRTPTARRCST